MLLTASTIVRVITVLFATYELGSLAEQTEIISLKITWHLNWTGHLVNLPTYEWFVGAVSTWERTMFVLFAALLLGRVEAVKQLKGSYRDLRTVFRQYEE